MFCWSFLNEIVFVVDATRDIKTGNFRVSMYNVHVNFFMAVIKRKNFNLQSFVGCLHSNFYNLCQSAEEKLPSSPQVTR